MVRKRRSLAELKKEDHISEDKDISAKGNQKPDIVSAKSESASVSSGNLVPEQEYAKLSASVPYNMFETLLDISRERRRARENHTISEMVREALTLWLSSRTRT